MLVKGRSAWLTRAVLKEKSNAGLAAGLVIAVALWGGNNAGTKWLVGAWPPIFTGGTRFLCAGLLLLAVWDRSVIALGTGMDYLARIKKRH